MPATSMARLVAGSIFFVLTVFLGTPSSADAVIQRIYTLPFYSSYDITCPWGPYANCGPGLPPGNHTGTDYSLGRNTTDGEVVAAAATGTAKPCPFERDGGGNYIVLDHGNGHRTRYLHLKNPAIPQLGQSVARGEVIGFEGTTGSSTGNHLHFDTRHGATTFTCGISSTDGTSVDPYAAGTYMWESNPPEHAEFAPALASWSSSRVDVFVRGKNNDLYQCYPSATNCSVWTVPRPGSCLSSAPAASTWGSSRIDVFARLCGSNDLWQTTWNGTSWSAFGRPLPGMCLRSGPAATSWGTNRIDVFVRGCNDVLFQATWNGSGWSLTSRGGCLRSGPGAVSWGTNRIDVFVRGCDDAVWHGYLNGTSWSGFIESLGGCTMLAPGVASWASNRLDVLVRGCLDGMYQISWNGSSWSGFVNRGGCLASSVGTDAWAPDWLDAFVRGCDVPSNVYKNVWNGSSWTGFGGFKAWP